jgi:hypothetical protein
MCSHLCVNGDSSVNWFPFYCLWLFYFKYSLKLLSNQTMYTFSYFIKPQHIFHMWVFFFFNFCFVCSNFICCMNKLVFQRVYTCIFDKKKTITNKEKKIFNFWSFLSYQKSKKKISSCTMKRYSKWLSFMNQDIHMLPVCFKCSSRMGWYTLNKTSD